jgi:hypothetical protein
MIETGFVLPKFPTALILPLASLVQISWKLPRMVTALVGEKKD